MARVLALNDDPLARRFIHRVLERAGHEVIEATEGLQALRIATERSLDLALVDLDLPGMDGVEVLQRLREIQPSCLRVLLAPQVDLPVAMVAVNRGEVNLIIEEALDTSRLLEAVSGLLQSRITMQEVLRVQDQAATAQEATLLLDCLSSSAVQIALQPILDATGGWVYAFEALLRSNDPIFPGPLALLNAAEKHNKLDRIDAVVVERVRAWMPQIPDPVRLFLNLHPDALADPVSVCARLEPLFPWAERIVLEITERGRLQSIDRWEESVRALTSLGFSIAVDDLGAGHSSLAVLAELQPSYIKVDMTIVRGVDHDPRKRRLITLLCRFADATQARFVAEGVETEAEAAALIECGAHLLQGYHFGRPGFNPVLAMEEHGLPPLRSAAR